MTPADNQTALLREFDQHSQRYADHWREDLHGLRSQCPVARSENHDGFWLLTRYADVTAVARDHARFSTDHDVSGDRNGYGGISIPPSPMRAVPLEMDPPEFTGVRVLLTPAFSPAASRVWLPWLRTAVDAQLDTVIESGTADLVYDLGAVVPGRFTMRFLGLPENEWHSYALPFHDFMSPPGSERYNAAAQNLLMLGARLYEQVLARRAAPAEDYISHLVTSTIDGEPVSDQLATEICFLIIAGGVDTTTSLFGDAVEWLGRNPEQRDRLIAEPELLPKAIEEFLRYFTPTQATARTASCPVGVGDAQLAAGDRVLLSWAAANQDPTEFPDPDTVVLDRFPNRHTSFGVGIHRCLGSNVARLELQAMLAGVLTRMPDYVIDSARAERYASIGITNGFLSLPATFTPGPRTASPSGKD